MWGVSFTHSMVAGGYFMWEVSLPHLVLAALCARFLLEKKKATETERECVSMCGVVKCVCVRQRQKQVEVNVPPQSPQGHSRASSNRS